MYEQVPGQSPIERNQATVLGVGQKVMPGVSELSPIVISVTLGDGREIECVYGSDAPKTRMAGAVAS